MSQVCCVQDCNHSRGKNKCTFKRFPTDSQKCKLWEDIIKRHGWERSSWDRICECHFSDEQFEQHRADGLRKLRWDAIPTLFGSNLRIPSKPPAEEVADKKDSEEALEENDDVEELEVEIEENSNSDECSDVETYIITGDLTKTIQVIKEKESTSTTRSSEKISSDSPATGKSKTRIFIRVPSSVGDSTPQEENVEEPVKMEEDGRTERNVGVERLTGGCSTEKHIKENCAAEEKLEEGNIIERNVNAGSSAETLEVENTAHCDPTKNLEVESVSENLGEDNASAEIFEENATEVMETDETATEGLAEEASSSEIIEATDTEMSEPQVSDEPPNDTPVSKAAVEYSSLADNVKTSKHVQLTDTDLSQLESDWKNPKLKARDVKIMACGGSSRILYKKKHQLIVSKAVPEQNPSKDGENIDSEEIAATCRSAPENLEDSEAMMGKSDVAPEKNPSKDGEKIDSEEIAATCRSAPENLGDPEVMMGESEAVFEKGETGGEKADVEEIAATCLSAPENLEDPEVMEGQKTQDIGATEGVVLEEATGNDPTQERAGTEGGLEVDAAPCEAKGSVSEVEVQVDETAEKVDPPHADWTYEVADPSEEKDGIPACGKRGADDTIASIEEKLEKIFSNDGENTENVQVGGFSADNLNELCNNDNVQHATAVQEQEAVTTKEMVCPDQVESGSEQISSVLEETDNPSVPPENPEDMSGDKPEEVLSDNNQSDASVAEETEANEKNLDIPSGMVVTRGMSDKTEKGISKDDPDKSGEVLKETSYKSSKKTREAVKADSGNKPIGENSNASEPKATEKASQSTKGTVPESKKHETSPKSHSVSRKSRATRDATEESRRSLGSRRDHEKHSNHKESSRRTDSDSAKKSTDKVSRQHNSHRSGDEKASSAKQPGKSDEGKKTSEEEKHNSDRKHKKVHSPSKESASRQFEKSPKSAESEETVAKSNIKTRDPPKELRSSKRCLISAAPPKSKQLAKKEEEEEEEEVEDDEIPEEEEERKSLIGKKAKTAKEAATPAQSKRRGRPPKGRTEERKEGSPEKAPPEESKSLRHSKRTPKPTEKYKDSQSGKSSRSEVSSTDTEASRRSQKRKLSSEDDDEDTRKSGRGYRSLKRKSSRAPSPPRKRQEVKSRRHEEEEEEDDDASNAQSLCRICGTEQLILLNIFGPDGTQLRLEDKIHSHLPIRVRQNDKLPLGVCHSCVVTLSACDSLVDKCTHVDKKFRKMFNCPAEETVEEDADHVRGRKFKPRSVSTDKAPDTPQVSDKGKKVDKSNEEQQRTVKTGETVRNVGKSEEQKTVKNTPKPTDVQAPIQEDVPETVVEEAAPEIALPQVEGDDRATAVESNETNFPSEGNSENVGETDREMDIADVLAEAVQHDAILVKKEVMEEMASPMKRFGNTYSTGRRGMSKVLEAMDTMPQDRNSVIVIPPAETLRETNNDVAPHSEEYILNMDDPSDEAPKTVIDSILDDWDEEDQDRASTSATSRVLTIKNPPDSEIVVTRLFNDEEEMLAEEEGGEIIIQIHADDYPGQPREESFWPTPDPSEETILPDTDEQQNLTWKCGECGLRGKSVGTFLEHKKKHQERKFFCSLCDQSFMSVEMLALHKKEKHYDEEDDDEDDDDDELSIHPKKSKSLAPLDIEEGGFYPGGNCKLYKCAQCDKMFGAAWSWKKHMEAHELDSSLADNRVHKCDICNRVFFDKTVYEDHRLTHTEGETPFQCSICDAKFTTWNVFLTHVHTHKSSKTICKKCGRDFGDSKTLREHVKSAHPVINEKKFACHLCDKVCRKKIALTEHLRKHTGETPFECEVCHKRFSRLANYRAHAAIHENLRRFACDICGKRFNRQSIQQRHMKTHMRDTIKTSHVCRVCGEAFNKVNELLEHRLNHTRDDVERAYWMDVKLRGDAQDFTCKVCDMRFTTVEAVLLHMPAHTDDERDIALKRKPKAYTCDICHRTLFSKRTYQTHKQWHEQKQFPCTQCDKKYATQTGLNYHMFLHTGERPFQCSFCDKCYKNKNDLRIHVRLHTGEYPYKCKFCPKAFRSPSSLIKHGDAHTEERPFKCNYCDQAFKRENTRANHERIHTNDKRFTCKYCNKGFIQKGACLKHEKWHENETKKGENPSVINSIDHEDNDSRDSLDLPEHSESSDSMDSYSVNMMEEHDIKEVDVVGLAMPSHSPQPNIAKPVDEANATAPSSADKNVHITLLG